MEEEQRSINGRSRKTRSELQVMQEDVGILKPTIKCSEFSCKSINKVSFKNPCDLNIVYINARSIKAQNKLREIETSIDLIGKVDIIVITETWLKPGTENYYNVPTYKAEHLCRSEKRGGGVGLSVKNGLEHIKVSEEQNVHDIIKIKVIAGKTSFYNIGLYNPPDNTLENFHEGLIDIIKSK